MRAEPASSLSPDAITSQLRSQEKELRVKAALAVGLNDPINGALCSDFDSVKTEPMLIEDATESQLLEVKSEACQDMFLVPLVKQTGSWQSLGPIRLSMHYGILPRYSIQNLLSKEDQEIVVSNVIVEWGTGVPQTNLSIYKVVGGRVRVVFDQPEHLVVDIPGAGTSSGRTYFEEQKSTFRFERDSGGSTFGTVHISEYRADTVGRRKFVLYRSYAWDKTLNLFRMEGEGPP